MDELSAPELAALVGVTEAEVERLVALGILVPRDGAGPFQETDAQKVRLATACEQAGLPMDGLLRRTLESAGFAWSAPDDPMREDELELVPLLRQVAATGILDLAWMTRIGRAWADGLRLAAKAESEAYHARVELPVLESGMGQQQALELSTQLDPELAPLLDRAVMAVYHRQQELAWIEDQVEHVEAALGEVGARTRPERVPAMCFLDLAGYTQLTEERGDQAAAALVESLAVLEMVEEIPAAGLPPAHGGVAAGPVVVQGGDYFGRTVNLAARIASRAGVSQVLVSESVRHAPPPDGVRFVELGEAQLKGFARPVRLLEACRA